VSTIQYISTRDTNNRVTASQAILKGIAEDGYRLIVNCNKHGGQEVFHLHMHLVGGEPLGRMLAK